MSIIKTVIEQHAEEAGFNWLLRNKAVGDPHYRLADLAQLDDFLDAHIDGLRIAGEAGWQICRDAMNFEEPGEIFTAGVLAFETQIPERMDAVLAVVEAKDDLKRALVSALGWIDFNTIAAPAKRFLSADSAFLKYIGLAAHAIHRRDPGMDVLKFMEDEDPFLRARALKAAGELGRLDLLPAIRTHLGEEEKKCRFHAAWSAAMMGDGTAIQVLKSLAVEPWAYARYACDLAVRKMNSGDAVCWLNDLCRHPELLCMASVVYGAVGAPETVPLLIEIMSIPEMARSAGEAFSMITGLDLDYEDLDGEPPEGFEAGPSEDPEEDDVNPDPDEDLPWPDTELISQWWDANQKHFKTAIRYLCGKPVSIEHCRHVLRHGYQRQRIAAALELALMAPGQRLFEVRAPGVIQQRLLA